MTVAYEVGTKFLNKSHDNTGLPQDYVLTVAHVTEDSELGYVYHDEEGYGIDHDWVEANYVEVV